MDKLKERGVIFMIGSGLKKLAQNNGMSVSGGVAYGSLRGYATTMSEGSGWKRLDISTRFPEPGNQENFQRAVEAVNVQREYRVQNLGIGQRFISVIFLDNPGTMKKIEAFIDWFYPLLAENGATGANICTECGAEISVGSWHLIDGIAYHLHDSCADHIRRSIDEDNQQQKQADTGSYGMGVLGALLGAALGAVVWALILMAGYVASIVGLLIGWLAEKGYTLLKGKQGKGKVVILIIAVIFGVLLGTFAADFFSLVQMINSGELADFTVGEVPMLIVSMLLYSSEYLSTTLGNVAMGLVFAGLGVFALLRKTGKEVSGMKMKKLN